MDNDPSRTPQANRQREPSVAQTPGGTPQQSQTPQQDRRLTTPPPILRGPSPSILRVRNAQPTTEDANSGELEALWRQLLAIRQQENAILRRIQSIDGGRSRPTSPLQFVSDTPIVSSPSARTPQRGTQRESIFEPIRF
jgi:hypothetical protein